MIDELRTENEEAFNAFDGFGNPQTDTNWFSSDEDMKEFSKKHPELVFKLDRSGEENGDLSITYYKNGKMQECPAIITYDDYDETKLV